MLTKIIEFSIKNKLIVGLFTIALLGYGIFQATQLPIDAVPDITNNQVQVITIAPSYGATDIERLITFPIEQANNNIPGLKEIRSFSRFGLSLVTIVFDDETDVYWARQQVSERLQEVKDQIPKGIGTPTLGPVSSGLGEIYQYMVRAKPGYENKFDETELRTIQDWIIRRQLLGVKGVAEVSSFGGKLKQIEIAINPNKLQSYHININDVFDALEKNNQNTGGAYIEKGPTVLYIRSEGLIKSTADIENISIKTLVGGNPLFMRDVADVKIGYATRYGAMCYNDQGEVAGAIVMMLKGANSSQVIKDVKERIATIQKTLPKGVMIEPFLDRTKMVNNAIGTVEHNLMEGALIVIFVLVVFLGNFRAGLLVASVIPLAMLFAIILMNTFGVSGNLMSLGALDFGLIVDGAVIIVEAVMHSLAHNKKFASASHLSPLQMDHEVTNSSSKMMNSAVFGQIIILIVYLPIFTLQGIEGKMFKPMAQTVAFALLGAFILSLTYIPMMSAMFLSKKIKHQPNLSDRLMYKVEQSYQRALEYILHYPKLVLTSVISLFVLALITLTFLGGEFIPALEEGDFAVDTRVLTGSNLTTTIASTQKAAHILKTQFPEVEKVVTKIGSGEVPTDPMPMEASDMMVIMKDKKEWKSAKTFDEMAAKMSMALEDVPGITAGFQYPVQMRFNELMTGARQDVVCKIFGENLDTLAKYAAALGSLASKVEGSQDLFVEPVVGMPQIIIDYNRAMIAQYGLNISDINRVVNTAFAGQATGLIFEDEKRFNVVVRLDGEQRKNLNDVQNLLIPTSQGTQIPLGQLADVQIQNGPNQIQREDAKRRIVVGFNVKDRDVQSIVNELKDRTDKELKLPSGYYVTYGGTFENLNAAKQRLMIAVPVSLILIFLLLFFAFNSIKHGLLIYSAIPLSAIGGIFFLALRGMPFSISAGVGFIALFGVAVLNGIVLIAEFNRLKLDGVHTELKQIVIHGTKLRLRPVLMTAFVASLGFLPMAISNGAGAEVQRPLATVVIGGLMIATLLTLFVLPILYIIFERGIKRKKMNPKSLATLLVIFMIGVLSNSSQAQTPITLDEAIQISLKNNLEMKHEKLKAEYQEAMTKTVTKIASTNFGFEVGQMNSLKADNRFYASQSFAFPQVYKAQVKLLDEELKSVLFGSKVKEAELIKSLKQVFYFYRYLSEKDSLLNESVDVYTEFVRKANLRFSKGESNVLEKASAETQLGQINLQRILLKQDIDRTQLQFQLLLNTETIYIPSSESLKIENATLNSSSEINQHPMLNYIRQQQSIASALSIIERKKLLPEWSVGYSNMSMRGIGQNDKEFSSLNRFHTVQFGISVPFANKAIKSKIASSILNEKIVITQYEIEKQQLTSQQKALQFALKSMQSTIVYYEEKALVNATLIRKTADRQFNEGQINYLEWGMLTNQSISIQHEYLEAIKNLNDTIIQLNYLTQQ